MTDDRRKHGGLTDEQIDEIREAILASIYEEIGRSIVRKILWYGGTIILALLAWFGYSGHVKIT